MATRRKMAELKPFDRLLEEESFHNGMVDEMLQSSNSTSGKPHGEENPGFFLSPESRELLLKRHPVSNFGYGFATTQLTGAYEIIVQRVKQRRTGLAFVASSRHGKTTGIELVARQLQKDLPDLVVLWFIAETHHLPSERTFFGGMLSFFRVRDPHKATADVLRTRIKNYFEIQGRQHQTKHIVLFIDEAQRLFVEEWEWLSDIMNYLKSRHISLTVISFGQPELLDRRNLAADSERQNLVARFFADMRIFSGIHDESELKAFLKQYDEQRYPISTGPTYTEFFLPLAWSSGFRLEQESTRFWRALQKASPLGTGGDFPLEFVVLSIHAFLYDMTTRDSADIFIKNDMWDCYVEESGFSETMALLVSTTSTT